MPGRKHTFVSGGDRNCRTSSANAGIVYRRNRAVGYFVEANRAAAWSPNRRISPMKKGVWIGCGLAALLGVVLCGGLIALIASGVWGLIAMTQPVADGANDFL